MSLISGVQGLLETNKLGGPSRQHTGSYLCSGTLHDCPHGSTRREDQEKWGEAFNHEAMAPEKGSTFRSGVMESSWRGAGWRCGAPGSPGRCSGLVMAAGSQAALLSSINLYRMRSSPGAHRPESSELWAALTLGPLPPRLGCGAAHREQAKLSSCGPGLPHISVGFSALPPPQRIQLLAPNGASWHQVGQVGTEGWGLTPTLTLPLGSYLRVAPFPFTYGLGAQVM